MTTPATTGTRKHRILLVDDDPDVRRSIGATLTAAGYDVIMALDGDEAVRLWRNLNSGDLVLLDLFMPEKDGLETIIELRSHTPGVPIIAMSGGGSTGRLDILQDAKMLGAIETLEKPFSSHVLLEMVARILANAM
jgi:two-component system, chemotaxis family, chemotaxis protein CheY